MKRFREPTLRYIEIAGELFIYYNSYIYKWSNPINRCISCIEDHNFDCDIVNSVLVIMDIRSEKNILSQPLQLIN